MQPEPKPSDLVVRPNADDMGGSGRTPMPPAEATPPQSGHLLQQLRWLVGGLAVGFLVPFVFADRLALPRDLYYGIYAVAVIAFLTAWVRSTNQSLNEMVRRHLTAALILGVAFAGIMSIVVMRTADSTARPDGLALVGALAWRGVLYGAIDGLLLSAFPILAVFAGFAGTDLRARRSGKLAIGALALMASLTMTAAYHLGYEQFRSSEIKSPMTGDVLWSVPTLFTLNPIAAPIAHVGLHVTAVLHSYDTDLFLPPHSQAESE